jgi:hypothetical protein
MAHDPRLLFHTKSLLIRAIHGNDALLPFMFTAEPSPVPIRFSHGSRAIGGGSARAQGGPQEASDGFWRSELCDRPPTPKRSYSQDLW